MSSCAWQNCPARWRCALFGQSSRELHHLIVDEVIASLSDRVLTLTPNLERMSAPICDSVYALETSPEMD